MNEHRLPLATGAVSPAPADLPARCDVLVVGAGPAGSACAVGLARAGVQTLLVDAADFPRDKTCGDGLIPDAHAAFKRLGVHEEVMAQAHCISAVRCLGPTGRHVDIPGQLAVLPRFQLDHILVRAAQRAGAQLVTPWRLDALLKDSHGRVSGGSFKRGQEVQEVQAQHTVLATGASSQGLVASQLCHELPPSGFGLRGYVRHPGLVDKIPHLEFFWHPGLKNGYGWIFPCGDGVFNIGVVYWTAGQRNGQIRNKKNLHAMLDDFAARHPHAGQLMREGSLVRPFKGAPLRVSLRGTRFAAPGILVTGEAAGSTYHFSGEGIGKAMETGLLAAQTLLANRQQGGDDTTLEALYLQALAQLQPKYEFYARANIVNRFPWLAELVIRKAAKSEFFKLRLSQLLEEKVADRPLTLGRILKRMWQ